MLSLELPSPRLAFFHAYNRRETYDFNSLFTHDAVVTDEERNYRADEIKEWIDEANEKYNSFAVVNDLTILEDKKVVSARVSGDFPGSPIQLRYIITLRDEKIASIMVAS